MCSINKPLRVGKPQPLSETEPKPIYLDYNATTPMCEEAWKAMIESRDDWGNPSSTHPYGLAAKYALDAAREKVARSLGSKNADTIIFTSGGTESNNLGIVGGALSTRSRYPQRSVIVLSCYEHPAVEEVAKFLEAKQGFSLCRVGVNKDTGVLDVELLQKALCTLPNGPRSVCMVTIMFANNEIGAVNPIEELCDTVKELCGAETLFHTDAAQALGKVYVNVEQCKVDLLSVCGHKFYAPKSSGALFIRDGVHISRILHGAGHEHGIRPGTENVLIAKAMAEALWTSVRSLPSAQEEMRLKRDELAHVLKKELEKYDMDYVVNGSLTFCLPNTLNCALFKKTPDLLKDTEMSYISAARLIATIGHFVCVSAGSACHSSAPGEELEVSLPLKAVGVDINRAIGTLRISTGRYLTMEEARRAAVIIARHAAQQFTE